MKFFQKRQMTFVLAIVILALMIAACTATTDPIIQEVEVTRVITETVIEEGQEIEVTVVVTEIATLEVTAVPHRRTGLTKRFDRLHGPRARQSIHLRKYDVIRNGRTGSPV